MTYPTHFNSGKYDCAGEDQQQLCKRHTRPIDREDASHEKKIATNSNKNLVLGPRCGLTVRCSKVTTRVLSDSFARR
jgi:hypothetical protein